MSSNIHLPSCDPPPPQRQTRPQDSPCDVEGTLQRLNELIRALWREGDCLQLRVLHIPIAHQVRRTPSGYFRHVEGAHSFFIRKKKTGQPPFLRGALKMTHPFKTHRCICDQATRVPWTGQGLVMPGNAMEDDASSNSSGFLDTEAQVRWDGSKSKSYVQ